MTILMTDAGPVAPDALLTRTGGTPLAPAGTAWPHCATCEGPMQFLAQILLDDLGRHAGTGASDGRGLLALFMCRNNPGGCQEWSPRAGGNRALLLPAEGARPLPLPDLDEHADEDDDPRLLGAVRAVSHQPAPGTGYARARLRPTPGRPLGQLGGEPGWLQYDETPECPGCARPMPFAAQLEEGPDPVTAMNFGGGGSAYAFACEPCDHAAFLWQC
ncbi:DUF1963 domain-containing protein [Kitasatospora sp. NPDC085879]|uniref:DUF1963 domain-containing protein n=1 Tax=Kitasatospora sp. NPDC085879 TaxID=3154769 RepID=UPI00343E6F68